MTRSLAFMALMATLVGCQSLENIGQSTAEYIKSRREPPPSTPMEQYLYDLRHPYVPLGTFYRSPEDKQGGACHSTVYNRTVLPAELQMVTAASEQGNAVCQHVLGTFYEIGHGVPKDLVRARALYLEAAPSDPYAYVELGRMARDGVDAPADFVKAREYYRLAGPAGVVGLGGLMEQGKGGPQDVQGALNLYMATTQKHLDPAWMAMRPLLASGQQLDAGQVEKYNRLWTKGLWALQNKWLNRMTNFNSVDRSVQLTVKVLYRFPAGRTRPDAYLTQSSGNPQADAVVVKALDKLPMDDPYLMPFGQPTPDIVAPVVLMPVADKPTVRAGL